MNIAKICRSSIFPAALLLLISYFSIFRGYSEPASFFWDENYHIAAAQKYLHGVFFMEPHPPLGKLLIAAGEFLIHPNEASDQFLQVDHAPTSPPGFSFAGYRFFPVLLATFCPLLLFLALRVFAGDAVSFFAGLLFATDNALIVHLRGAMLEGIQLFFILAFILTLAHLIRQVQSNTAPSKQKVYLLAVLLGISLACVLTTKINGVVLLILLIPALYLVMKRGLFFFFSLNLSISFLLVFFSVWFLHINLGHKIEPKLPDDGYYQASIPYRISLQGGSDKSLNFISRLYDHFAFLPHYTKGVPKLNYCKKTENGSPWYWWPVGGKSINYRWEKKDNLTHFLYLVANPLGWSLSLLGVLLAGLVFASSLIFKPVVSKGTQLISSTLLFTWLFYIGIFGSLGRVMYLYHYFIPLILGWMMLCLLSSQVTHVGSVPLTLVRRQTILVSFAVLQILSFLIFSPFTYARGLSDKGISMRNWLAVWDIHCVDCESGNPLARPIGDPKISVNSNISISGLRAIETYQGWGEPKMDLSVTGEVLLAAGTTYKSGIGVHAESRVVFATNKGFMRFSAKVALPDYLISRGQGSVIFKVIGDGKELWRSSRITAGIPPESVSLDISRFDRITLEVDDAGDGINSDHALWLEPRFE